MKQAPDISRAVPCARTDIAASRSWCSAKALKNRMASNKFDLPTPFAPAMQVKGPKCTSTSTRFLNPVTLRACEHDADATLLHCYTTDFGIPAGRQFTRPHPNRSDRLH